MRASEGADPQGRARTLRASLHLRKSRAIAGKKEPLFLGPFRSSDVSATITKDNPLKTGKVRFPRRRRIVGCSRYPTLQFRRMSLIKEEKRSGSYTVAMYPHRVSVRNSMSLGFFVSRFAHRSIPRISSLIPRNNDDRYLLPSLRKGHGSSGWTFDVVANGRRLLRLRLLAITDIAFWQKISGTETVGEAGRQRGGRKG